MAQRDISTYQ